jgi:mono/diheme cytochrome c family protein
MLGQQIAMRSITSLTCAFTLAVVIGNALAGQDTDGTVPKEFLAMKNPVAASPEATAAGKLLYVKNCERCHGPSGLGDGPATKFIRPAPKEIASAVTQDRLSDGEIFYKITEGKKPMPAMKMTLSEEQRWQIVHFVRTLRK